MGNVDGDVLLNILQEQIAQSACCPKDKVTCSWKSYVYSLVEQNDGDCWVYIYIYIYEREREALCLLER